METEEKSGGMGGVMAVIIIIIILLAGGWYFIGNRVEKIQNQKQVPAVINEITTGTSTELTDIEKDLENLNLDALDLD